MEPIETEKSSQALVFCSKIMFEVVPESRKVRRGNREKVWKFIFNKKNEKHVVHIVTYKRENTVPKNEDKSMILTVEQAGLIALETFERLIKVAYTNGHKLMTPSAGAYFSKDDLPALAKELNISEVDLLIKTSQSTQRDGHYLEFSDIDIAICASIAATRNMKEGSLKKNIVEKKFKQRTCA